MGTQSNDRAHKDPETQVTLCASCDRCRARKTKCDGSRPCSNCAIKYMKKHKLTSIEGIDIREFNCVYSPAKRRGPVPGRVLLARNRALKIKSEEESGTLSHGARDNNTSSPQMLSQNIMTCLPVATTSTASNSASGTSGSHLFNPGEALIAQQRQLLMQAQGLNGFNMNLNGIGDPSVMGLFGASGTLGRTLGTTAMANPNLYQTRNSVSSDIGNQQAQNMFAPPQQQFRVGTSLRPDTTNQSHDQANRSQRMKLEPKLDKKDENTQHLLRYESLLHMNNQEGNMLRSYFMMSINEVFNLPPVPLEDEYCRGLALTLNPMQLPRNTRAALHAARYAEVALGAQANFQSSLALELSNATVLCLRECVKNPVHASCLLYVARAYFLHGVFRSMRGDFERYLKYRKMCMSHLKELNKNFGVNQLLAAIAFHDSWVYMMHNASEKELPDVSKFMSKNASNSSSSDPKSKYFSNEVWMKGPPPIYLDNDAPPLSRSLDALASAVRTCCEQANQQFAAMESCQPDLANDDQSNTQYVVTSQKEEFCARNMVLSAHKLLQSHEIQHTFTKQSYGQRLIISAMDAFLEDGENSCEGFTDAQVQSILFVCNTTIERPLLLHGGGPIYHIISNAAIILCHLLNGMYGRMNDENPDSLNDMETTLFEEVLDTFTAIRKLLNMHRRKVPIQLRCHYFPRAQMGTKNSDLIDLNETIMCKCRGCQGFVLMKCSPCVAAERAQRSMMEEQYRKAHEQLLNVESDTGKALKLGEDAELDEALLSVLQELISTN